MKLEVQKQSCTDHNTNALVLGVFKDNPVQGVLADMNKKLNNELSRMQENKELTGEKGEVKVVATQGNLPAQKLVLVGLGEEKKLTTETLRRASAKAAKAVRCSSVQSFSTTLQDCTVKEKNLKDTTQAVVEGILLGLYDFKKYVTVDKDKIKKVKEATILTQKDEKEVKEGCSKGKILSENVNYVRDLVNEQPAIATPTYLASEAKKLEGKNCSVKVFGQKEIEKMKMGGLLGVAKGSSQEPKFIVMEYKGASEDPVVFVGKGITFDSGGLDVKPAKYMEDMKCDMAGAATVIATIKAIQELGLKRHVVGIVPTCENLLGPDAFKQGDILTAYNGKTIEVWHTDAEGRLILADGLSYAEKHYKAKAIFDIATLTGASVIALGYDIISAMGTDEALMKQVLNAAKLADEEMWQLPLLEDYKELVKGDIGDTRNTAKGDAGPGTITAGLFLNNFVEKTPWLHWDIGASGWAPKDSDYKKKGGTGVCLRTFVKYLEETQ
jgi:leucyl aminopeptidase